MELARFKMLEGLSFEGCQRRTKAAKTLAALVWLPITLFEVLFGQNSRRRWDESSSPTAHLVGLENSSHPTWLLIPRLRTSDKGCQHVGRYGVNLSPCREFLESE